MITGRIRKNTKKQKLVIKKGKSDEGGRKEG